MKDSLKYSKMKVAKLELELNAQTFITQIMDTPTMDTGTPELPLTGRKIRITGPKRVVIFCRQLKSLTENISFSLSILDYKLS